MRKWTPVIVVWRDAVSYQGAARSTDEHHPVVRKSIGFFISQDAEKIVICTDDDRSSRNMGDDCGGISVIPRGWATDMIALTERPTRSKKATQ